MSASMDRQPGGEGKVCVVIRHHERSFRLFQGGSMYLLAMEPVLGGDLYKHVKNHRGGKLDEKATRTFGRQLVSAIAHMHSKGVVHRYVEPRLLHSWSPVVQCLCY
ncbi:hypothetical protein PR048_009833 [Dryococelus australis]|uniref:Protein kinase domain-containing protein n=1 Tax=Dryococelus australis TaxID=614101 RepID=A0ABQ9I122_9NEOP|nr:hypothetical protein PR048_009833 [Dryococelus australis]